MGGQRGNNLYNSNKSVHLQCVFHNIRFKVNKGWSTAVLLFLCPYSNLELTSVTCWTPLPEGWRSTMPIPLGGINKL